MSGENNLMSGENNPAGKNNLQTREPSSSSRWTPAAIIKLPECLTLLTLETYNLCFIASKLLTVADMMVI